MAARQRAKLALKRLKQQINAFVLRHGHQYTGMKWTIKHVAWLKKVELDPIYRETLNEYMASYEEQEAKIERYDKRIEEIASEARYQENAKKLGCFLNYARTFDLSGDVKTQMETDKNAHFPFSEEEMALLWDNLYKIDYVDVLLVQCYSGWRPQELGLIKLEDVDLKSRTITGGIKTKAGKDRLVPIHPRIYDLVLKRYEEAKNMNSNRLFNCFDSSRNNYFMTYDKYRHRFDNIKRQLGLNELHRAHDGRTHFVTMAKKYKVDEYAIKYIVGHEIRDITEKVYTYRDVEWLKTEIEKIV